MRWYLFWAGGLIIVMVIAIVLAAQLYPKHVTCERFGDTYFTNSPPEASMTPVTPDWYVLADCSGVQNDLYVAYYILAIGAALIGIGAVMRR